MGMETNGTPNKTNAIIIKNPNLNATPRQKACIERLAGLRKYPQAIRKLAGAHHAINALVRAKNARRDMKHVVLPAECFYAEYNADLTHRKDAEFLLEKDYQSTGIEVYQLAAGALGRVRAEEVERESIVLVEQEEKASTFMALDREI